MKLNELLLEARERIERHGNYGQLFDTRNGKIYPVRGNMHHDMVLKDMQKELFNIDTIVGSGYGTYMELGYANDFVRVEHGRPTHIGYAGSKPAIKKSVPLIRSSAMQPDIMKVYIETVKEDEQNEFLTDISEEFSLPHDRNKLIQFLNTL